MVRRKKDAVQIRFEILEHLRYKQEPMLRTHLWRRTSLSYDDFLKHVMFLVERGFVREADSGFTITSKGRNVYDELKDVLPKIL